MSAPFGGHPTFGQYIEWAREAGCRVDQGVMHTEDGRAYGMTRIVAPGSEKWLMVIGTLHTEFLMATTIARFDRRLGLKSPYFSIVGRDTEKDGGAD